MALAMAAVLVSFICIALAVIGYFGSAVLAGAIAALLGNTSFLQGRKSKDLFIAAARE